MTISLTEQAFGHDVLIAPSILSADFGALNDSIRQVEDAGADLLHIDVMDGHFVPNLTMGPNVVSCIRKRSGLLFDVHLMISEPLRYVEAFAKAGADHMTIHVESSGDLSACIAKVHECGCTAGITLRPGTPASGILPYLDQVEMVLVMTVEPGFGGQSFMNGQLSKIGQIKKWIDESGKKIYLEVDGGVAPGTARLVKAAGANILVAGSSVFGSKSGYGPAMDALRADK